MVQTKKKKPHDPLRENNHGTVLSSGTFIPGLLRNSCALQPPGWAFSSSLHTPERFSAKARDVPGFGCHRVPSDGKERQGCVPKCQPYSASCISQNIPRAGCRIRLAFSVSLHYGLGWEFSHDCNGLNCTQGSKLELFLIAGGFFSLYSALGEHILSLRLGALLLPCSEGRHQTENGTLSERQSSKTPSIPF